MQNAGDPILATVAIILIGSAIWIIYRNAFSRNREDAPGDGGNDAS